MLKKWLWAGIAGGLVAFIWGFFSWMVLPWHHETYHSFKNEAEVAMAIKENATGSGMYMLPAPPARGDEKAAAKSAERMKKGPFLCGYVSVEGMRCHWTMHLLPQLLVQILGGLTIAGLLLHTKGLEFKQKVLFSGAVGLAACFLVVMPGWIWMCMSGAAALAQSFDLIIAWLLGGAAIARLLK